MSIQLGPEWEQFGRRLQAFPQDLETNMRTTLTQSLLMVERDARVAAPQDTRRLSGSITHAIRGTGLALEGRVGPSVRYGAPQEFGAHYPGKGPPPQALLGWVRRHWTPRGASVRPGTQFPGRARNRSWRGREAELLHAAIFLSGVIKRRGLPARPYLRPAYERNRAAIAGLFARMGVRVVARLAGGAQGGTSL